MKNRLFLVLVFFSVLVSMENCFGQDDFELPQNIVLKTNSDFSRYEMTVVKASAWLEQVDLDKEKEKRQRIDAFVTQWISGSPNVNLTLTKALAKIYGKNVQLLPIYLASYARNVIEHHDSTDVLAASRSGLISMMNVYKKGIEIKKTKEMEKILGLNPVQLDIYVSANLKQ
jgi:hypothetical protein